MKITATKNKEKANRIREAIRANGGYCPSKENKKEENRCICSEFYAQKSGWCACGLYKMEAYD